MENTIIQKFMDTMGITYTIEPSRSGISGGKPYVCYAVIAFHKGKKEYEQYHCYNVRNGKVFYEEGNESIGPDKGIFAYLAMNPDVRRFFEIKTRRKAEEFLNNLWS